jgi:predicted ATPase
MTQRIARRHAVAYLSLAEQLEGERNTAPDAEWLARAEPDLENWRAALTWSFGTDGDVELGQRLAGALRPVWLGGISRGARSCLPNTVWAERWFRSDALPRPNRC